MTPAQLSTLKAFILADPTLSAQPMTSAGSLVIQAALNADASPAFIVWRHDVTADENGNAWMGTDIDGMSALNMQRLQLLLSSSATGVFDMRRADRRSGFENPFGTNVSNASRVAMRAAWKRSARVVEKLYATGTGSDATPATTTFVGGVTTDEIQQARELP